MKDKASEGERQRRVDRQVEAQVEEAERYKLNSVHCTG